MTVKNLFFGGVPTEPDVKKLREQYTSDMLIPGFFIPYGDIEQVIGEKRLSGRFKSVTNQWRKAIEKEFNVIIGTRAAEGFYVLNDVEKVGMSAGKLRSAARFARRSYMVASRVDVAKLTEDEKRRLDHQQGVAAKIIASAQLRGQKQLPAV